MKYIKDLSEEEINMDVAIIGTGKFALAILKILSRNIESITIYGRDTKQLTELEINKKNSKYSDHIFDIDIKTYSIDKYNTSNHSIYFYCLPISCIDTINYKENTVYTCKGFKKKFLYQKNLKSYGLLMGPSYAYEILNDSFTTFSLSSNNETLTNNTYKLLKSNLCKLYKSPCIKSIEILSVIKNILSIGCGLIDSLNMGKNTVSAFIIIFLENVSYDIYPINKNVLFEPSGIGDIFLTCSSQKSRNYTYGYNLLNKDYHPNEKNLVEGINSLKNIINIVQPSSFISKFANIIFNYDKFADIKSEINNLLNC